MKKFIYTISAFLFIQSSLLAQENGFPSIKLKSTNGQMIDLAEKEGFNHLELTDINFPDGILFNRVQRLNKLQKIKICNTNIMIFWSIFIKMYFFYKFYKSRK
jgi:hypothetical protein